MGTTIHYHGCIEDRDRIEEFEVRVLDLAWETGASAQVWRSTAEEDPTRARRFVPAMLRRLPAQPQHH